MALAGKATNAYLSYVNKPKNENQIQNVLSSVQTIAYNAGIDQNLVNDSLQSAGNVLRQNFPTAQESKRMGEEYLNKLKTQFAQSKSKYVSNPYDFQFFGNIGQDIVSALNALNGQQQIFKQLPTKKFILGGIIKSATENNAGTGYQSFKKAIIDKLGKYSELDPIQKKAYQLIRAYNKLNRAQRQFLPFADPVLFPRKFMGQLIKQQYRQIPAVKARNLLKSKKNIPKTLDEAKNAWLTKMETSFLTKNKNMLTQANMDTFAQDKTAALQSRDVLTGMKSTLDKMNQGIGYVQPQIEQMQEEEESIFSAGQSTAESGQRTQTQPRQKRPEIGIRKAPRPIIRYKR